MAGETNSMAARGDFSPFILTERCPPQGEKGGRVFQPLVSGQWKRRRVRFAMVTASGLDEVHEGPPELTLDHILRFDHEPGEVGDKLGASWDAVIFQDDLAVAVVHRRDGKRTMITRIPRPLDE